MSVIQCDKPIAILLAAYNAEKYIAAQIESIINQTCCEWHLYIRNDGSKDATQDIIDDFCSTYPDKITQIDKGGENLGCNGNFFRLLERIDSDYYMFCDSDDVWLRDKVAILYSEICKQESEYPNKPLLVQSDSIVCDENLVVIEPSLWKSLRYNPNKFCSYNMIAVACGVGGASSILNKESKLVIYPVPNNKRILYDHWIAMCIAKNGKVYAIDRATKMYRQHAGQVCGLRSKNAHEPFFKRMQIIFADLHDNAIMLKDVGYGSCIKFYFWKIIAIGKRVL